MQATAAKGLSGIVAAMALAAVTACATHPWYVPEGPEAYRDGYRDGCRTGALARSAGAGWTERKAKKRYQDGEEYRRGWDEGRRYCEENPVIAPYSNEPGEPGVGSMGGSGPGGGGGGMPAGI